MSNLDNKYKERSPEETIRILKQFFTQKGYTLKKVIDNYSEAGTYSCRWDLFMYGTYIMGANGKGMTNEFCEASGLAELYERFCAQTPFLCNKMGVEAFMNLNYKKYGYYLDKDEYINKPNYVLNTESFNDFISSAFNNNQEYINTYLDLILGEKSINVPFKFLDDETKKVYLDPRVIMRVYASNGLAAGNTEEEAINQAMSEIYERIITERFFAEPQNTYYAIDLEKLKDTYMYDTYKNIQSLGYDVYVLDLSYNFKLPVLMSIIINKRLGNIHINFGSFPIFEIALERIITENYQGIISFNSIGKIQKSSKDIELPSYVNQVAANTLNNLDIIPEDLFDKIEYIVKCSSIFISNKQISNSEIKEKCIEYNKALNLKVVYKNISLIDEITTVRLFIINNIGCDMYYAKKINFSGHTDEFYNFHMQALIRQNLLCESIMLGNFELYCALLDYNLKIMESENYNGTYIGDLLFANWDYIWNTPYSYTFDVKDIIEKEETFYNSFSYNEIRKYATLYNYKMKNCNFEETKTFFKRLGFNITFEDWNNITSYKYVMYKAYFKPMIDFYNSEDYKKLLNTFTK